MATVVSTFKRDCFAVLVSWHPISGAGSGDNGAQILYYEVATTLGTALAAAPAQQHRVCRLNPESESTPVAAGLSCTVHRTGGGPIKANRKYDSCGINRPF